MWFDWKVVCLPEQFNIMWSSIFIRRSMVIWKNSHKYKYTFNYFDVTFKIDCVLEHDRSDAFSIISTRSVLAQVITDNFHWRSNDSKSLCLSSTFLSILAVHFVCKVFRDCLFKSYLCSKTFSFGKKDRLRAVCPIIQLIEQRKIVKKIKQQLW